MQKSDKASQRQGHQLSLIAQYTTQIEYIKGADNTVADSLSRVESIRLPVKIDLNDLAAKQEADEQLKAIRESPDYPLSLKRIQWRPAHISRSPFVRRCLTCSISLLTQVLRSPIDSYGSAMYGPICTLISRECVKIV